MRRTSKRYTDWYRTVVWVAAFVITIAAWWLIVKVVTW